MRAEQITDPVAHHGEGPVWDDALGVLHFVDMLAGDLLSFAPESAVVHRRHLASVLAAVRPRRAGGLVLAVERGFALLDSLDAPVEFLEPLWSDPGMRMNEGGCDPAGGFYCGGMATTDDADAATGRAALYRLSPDLHTRLALAGVTISNGLAWAPDGSFAYYVDSPTQRIDRVVFDPESGVVTERRPFATIPAESGAPDGLTVDAEGGVWTALFGGGAVRRYRPDGSPDVVVEVPVPYVTACAFGGKDLATLYITTSAEPPGARTHPISGALFRVATPVVGLPAAQFAG